MKEFGLFVIIAFVIIFSPIGTIWMLNTLFGLGLSYTLKTWAAALILDAMVSGQVKKNS